MRGGVGIIKYPDEVVLASIISNINEENCRSIALTKSHVFKP